MKKNIHSGTGRMLFFMMLRYYGIPVPDRFAVQGVNEFNCGLYCLEDKLHLNEDGYSLIGGRQAAFLAQ